VVLPCDDHGSGGSDGAETAGGGAGVAAWMLRVCNGRATMGRRPRVSGGGGEAAPGRR
jgi:hypothetical protein